MKLSAVILAKNESKVIKKALDSLTLCDEIIVIDDDSTDDTAQIAKDSGATVYARKLQNDFASQRNYAMEKARGEWILFLDADEELSEELQNEIRRVLESARKEITAYYIKRRDYWWGRELKYGEIKRARTQGFIRLIRSNSGKWTGQVHEVFQPSLGSTQTLNSFINHYPHPTLREFLRDINYYSTIRAKEISAKNKRMGILEILLVPFSKFISTFFVRLGFFDGAAGFAYAFLMSFHSFLVRVKVYQYQRLDSQ